MVNTRVTVIRMFTAAITAAAAISELHNGCNNDRSLYSPHDKTKTYFSCHRVFGHLVQTGLHVYYKFIRAFMVQFPLWYKSLHNKHPISPFMIYHRLFSFILGRGSKPYNTEAVLIQPNANVHWHHHNKYKSPLQKCHFIVCR